MRITHLHLVSSASKDIPNGEATPLVASWIAENTLSASMYWPGASRGIDVQHVKDYSWSLVVSGNITGSFRVEGTNDIGRYNSSGSQSIKEYGYFFPLNNTFTITGSLSGSGDPFSRTLYTDTQTNMNCSGARFFFSCSQGRGSVDLTFTGKAVT